MSIGYLLGGGLSPVPGIGVEMYERYPLVRRLYTDVAGWTGYSVPQLLQQVPVHRREGRSWALPELQQVALQLGIHDVLADAGVHPAAVGGVSVGAMVSGALAGSITRPDLCRLLIRSDDVPEVGADGPRQAFALAMLPADVDLAGCHEPVRADVYLSAEFGPSADGSRRVVMLSGYRAALDELVADLPEHSVFVGEDLPVAVHSPLRQHVRDHMAPYLAATGFRPPAIPLCSCLARTTLTTAEQVRDLFDRNPTHPVSLVDVAAEMVRHGVQLGLVLGTSIPDGLLRFPFPTVHVERPDQVNSALAAIYDLGVDLPSAQVG